jgi:PAS domain S-box-containing protein
VINAVEARRAARQRDRDRRAMAAAWDGISLLDESGRFTYVNEAYAETFRAEEDDLVGRSWDAVYPDEGTETVQEEVLPAVEEHGTWTGDARLLRRDGTEFVGEHTVANIDDGGLVCVLRDRTERDELDRRLRHERERFRLLVEAVEEYAIFVLDAEGYVETWNAGAERIKGYEPDEIVGEHFSLFYTEADRATDLPTRLLERVREAGVATDRGERVRKDGATFHADVTITPLYERDELRGYAKVTRDVTDEVERQRRSERNETYRRRLYEITTDPDRTLEAKVVDTLGLGADYLGLEHGHLVAIDPATDRHEVVAVSGDHPTVEAGAVAPLGETYCRRTLESDGLLAVSDAPAAGWSDDTAYESFGLDCYLGATIEIDGEVFGTVCFVDREPREPFREDEKTFVELLARWLTFQLDRSEDHLAWPLSS